MVTITGDIGKYIGRIAKSVDDKAGKSVEYGRNAISNYLNHMIKNSEDYEKLQQEGDKYQTQLDQERDKWTTQFKQYKQEQDESKRSKINETLKAIGEKQADILKKAKEVTDKQLQNFSESCPFMRLKYLPENPQGKITPENLDTRALMGASFEDLGGKESISVSEIDDKYKRAGINLTAKAFADADGNIHLAGNAAQILMKDTADKCPDLEPPNITGEFGSAGENGVFACLDPTKVSKNKEVVEKYINIFKLDEAEKDWLSHKHYQTSN